MLGKIIANVRLWFASFSKFSLQKLTFFLAKSICIKLHMRLKFVLYSRWNMPIMELNQIQLVVLACAVTFLLAQVFVRNKSMMHILFAIFCGSVAMATTKKITGDAIGAYQYLIGIGACATCNVYWLLARSLFREKVPFTKRHVLFASIVSILTISSQSYRFADSYLHFAASTNQFVFGVLGEMTVMMSSAVLLLSMWEAINGFSQADALQKKQRLLFLSMFFGAVGTIKLIEVIHSGNPDAVQYYIAAVTVMVMCTTQCLINWVKATRSSTTSTQKSQQTMSKVKAQPVVSSEDDKLLAANIRRQLINEERYLQPQLKVADLARMLDTSEYRISRVMNNELGAKNFNQFVNKLRVERAKRLLEDPSSSHWPVLVIGLESGFASVRPFTRAFKTMTGKTPNQYRNAVLDGLGAVEHS